MEFNIRSTQERRPPGNEKIRKVTISFMDREGYSFFNPVPPDLWPDEVFEEAQRIARAIVGSRVSTARTGRTFLTWYQDTQPWTDRRQLRRN